jgi:hypothetical protein
MNVWNRQSDEAAQKGSKQLSILKAVSCTDWGFDKETLLLTFNAMIKPTFTLGAPIWFPNMNPTNVEKMQKV